MANTMAQLDKNLDLYLVKKAPALPNGAKEAIVKIGPWVILVLLILSLPVILALFGIGVALSPFAYMGGAGEGLLYTVGMILVVVALVLEALALPGLFKRQMKGWTLMYYSVLVSALSNLLNLNIIGLLIGTLISLYLLYQVKSYYK